MGRGRGGLRARWQAGRGPRRRDRQLPQLTGVWHAPTDTNTRAEAGARRPVCTAPLTRSSADNGAFAGQRSALSLGVQTQTRWDTVAWGVGGTPPSTQGGLQGVTGLVGSREAGPWVSVGTRRRGRPKHPVDLPRSSLHAGTRMQGHGRPVPAVWQEDGKTRGGHGVGTWLEAQHLGGGQGREGATPRRMASGATVTARS